MNLVNWLTEKMIMIYCFISRSFSSGIMKCYTSGTIHKTAIFWNPNCYICGNMRKIITFWNSNCYKKIMYILPFYWKCCISWKFYKFASFSINYVKLKLNDQLLQGLFIVCRGRCTDRTGLFKFDESIYFFWYTLETLQC